MMSLQDGISITDRFLAPAEVSALLECAHAREQRGDFAAARVGGAAPRRREGIRGDFTCWIREPLYPAERGLFDDLERLRLELNRSSFLGLFDLELHYAHYPPGAGYARHVDQPQGSTQRRVSIVLYLNDEWEREAGGVLRMFDAGGACCDIEPIGGRLVCFLTPGREHEVLAARRDRYSISGWFRTRDP